MLSILTNEKHFPKTISQWEFDCAGLQIYRELLSLATFPEFTQTQKRYPTFLDKIRILT